MTRVASPLAKVCDAMPGTLTEIATATGYPIETVLRMIGQLRAGGLTITYRNIEFEVVTERTTEAPGTVDGSAEVEVP